MKILYVDVAVDGHHIPYCKSLIDRQHHQSILAVPQKIQGMECSQYQYGKIDFMHKTISAYLNWLEEIRLLAEKENPDIIHFLYGDVFYKFLGLGLRNFRKFKTIMTFHGIYSGFLGKMSFCRVSRKIDYGVLHTEYLLAAAKNKRHIDNMVHIEYPQFDCVEISCEEARQFWNITSGSPVLACIGNTRYDKGLDILLEALKGIEMEYTLLIAGKAEDFTKEFIDHEIADYGERVIIYLSYLNDQELAMALNAADIIVLPYRKCFTGASGPMGEGVWLRKSIIGPDCGSIGAAVRNHRLGTTFHCEQPESLKEAIQEMLKDGFAWNEQAEKYRLSLSTQIFQKKYQFLYDKLCSK